MELVGILDESVAGLDQCVQLLSTSFPPPHWMKVNGFEDYRHHPRHRHHLLLSFMKLVKIASHHNAAMVLIRSGYVQEVYALCRMIDEACEDIQFVRQADSEDGKPSRHQQRFIDEFFQEEFSGRDFLESHVERDRVPRKKVRATNARLPGTQNPDRDVKVGGVLADTYSGFVHGAYVHLMETFDGLHFHTKGMIGTPRVQECLRNQVHYVFRSLIALEGLAFQTSREDVWHRTLDLSISLARLTKCIKPEGVESMVKSRRQSLKNPA